MKVVPKFEIQCGKCGCTEIVARDHVAVGEPLWPHSWLRFRIESEGNGEHVLCVSCKQRFWAWMKEMP